MTNTYYSFLQDLKPSICFVSHGNYIEYVSLLVALSMSKVLSNVFSGGFAHKYALHNLNWGQPGPINSLNQLLDFHQGGLNFIKSLTDSTRQSLDIKLSDLHMNDNSNIVAYGGRETKNL